MRLYIIRHGQAESQHINGSDSERALTEAGVQGFTTLTQELKTNYAAPNIIIHSPYKRTTQTAQILSKAWSTDMNESLIPLSAVACLASGGGVDDIINTLLEVCSQHDEVALVGHEPTMSTLAHTLLKEPRFIGFRPGSVLVLNWEPVATYQNAIETQCHEVNY
jgi:phosphohistidine phosphatase